MTLLPTSYNGQKEQLQANYVSIYTQINIS